MPNCAPTGLSLGPGLMPPHQLLLGHILNVRRHRKARTAARNPPAACRDGETHTACQKDTICVMYRAVRWLALAAFATPLAAQTYDLVIANGRCSIPPAGSTLSASSASIAARLPPSRQPSS